MGKFKSVFDIIGPIMIGPSSSHTAGAARIGRVARSLFEREPKWANIHLYGSFAKTHKGHGTDEAIVGGILDFETDDENIICSLEIAKERGIEIQFIEEEMEAEHPNTAKIIMGDELGQIEVTGISIGGGNIEIVGLNGYELHISGEHSAIIVLHHDRFGVIANVTNLLSKNRINIGLMEVARKEKGKVSLMTIEVDHNISDELMKELSNIENVVNVTRIVN